MSKISLKAEKRTVTGKAVKKLRREGILPINLYGKDIKSINLMTKFADFTQSYKQAKTTQVVYLEVGKEEYPALIQNLQLNPTTRKAVHADFKKVDLKQKTAVEVPIEVVGELDVVKSGEADLIVLHAKILVECLPTNIPEKIIIEISKLEGIGAEVKVKDLPQSKEYAYQLDPEVTVIQVSAAQKEEIPVAPEPTTEEGAAPAAEGVAQAEEKATDKPKEEAKAE
jgi:large subunit ribosomal protein L25